MPHTLRVNQLTGTMSIVARAALLAGGLALSLTVGSACLLVGDGIPGWTQAYYSVRSLRGFYGFIRGLPLDKQFAGQITYIDRVPLFAWHRAYVTKALAHPFRPGCYAEAERRMRLVYTALYSSSLAEIVRVADQEKIDFLIYDTDLFNAVDKRLFEPVKREMAVLFKRNKQIGFALAQAPESALAYRKGKVRLLGIRALADALAGGEGAAIAAVPALERSDPGVDDGLADGIDGNDTD